MCFVQCLNKCPPPPTPHYFLSNFETRTGMGILRQTPQKGIPAQPPTVTLGKLHKFSEFVFLSVEMRKFLSLYLLFNEIMHGKCLAQR